MGGLVEIIVSVAAVLLAGTWFRGNYYKHKKERAETRAEIHRSAQYKAEEELKLEREINQVKEKAHDQADKIHETVGSGSDRIDLGVGMYQHGDKIRHD